jgi:hypothetical protein
MPRPGRFNLDKEKRYPLWHGTFFGPKNQCGRLRKIVPQLRFEPRILQPAAIRYNEFSTPGTDIQRS